MAYDPPDTFASLRGNSPAWGKMVGNHNEVQQEYAPAIIDQPLAMTSTSTSFADRAHFRVRDNHALHPIRVRIRAGCTTGSGTIKVVVGAASFDQAITGAQTWYAVDVTPLVADPDCYLRLKVTSGGHSLEVTALQVYVVPVAGSDVSGWVSVDAAVWATGDSPVPSRVTEELLNGSLYIARDRPFCTFSRVSDTTIAISGKTAEAWGADNSTTWQVMGEARLSQPLDTVVGGVCRLDAYVTRTGSPDVSIAVGAQRWTFEATADGWYTTTMRIGQGGPIVVSGLPGYTDEVAVRTLQIWRGG